MLFYWLRGIRAVECDILECVLKSLVLEEDMDGHINREEEKRVPKNIRCVGFSPPTALF
jgi:hypothetical protein